MKGQDDVKQEEYYYCYNYFCRKFIFFHGPVILLKERNLGKGKSVWNIGRAYFVDIFFPVVHKFLEYAILTGLFGSDPLFPFSIP